MIKERRKENKKLSNEIIKTQMMIHNEKKKL